MSGTLVRLTHGNERSLTQEERNRLATIRNRVGLGERQIDPTHLGLIFDATGSMEPYWENAKKNIRKLYQRLQELMPELSITFIAYRDYANGDQIIEVLKRGKNLEEIETFINRIRCIGNDDIPEAIEVGLKTALNVGIGFGILLGNSEPHGFPGGGHSIHLPEESYRYVAKQLNERGIPIYTVATHNNEALVGSFKEIAQLTQGKFFLMEAIDDLIDIFSMATAKRVNRVNAFRSILEKEQNGKLTDQQIKLLNSGN